MPQKIVLNGVEHDLYLPGEIDMGDMTVEATRTEPRQMAPGVAGTRAGMMIRPSELEAAYKEGGELGREVARVPLTAVEGAGQLMTGVGQAIGVPGAELGRYNEAVEGLRTQGPLRRGATPGTRMIGDVATAVATTPTLRTATWLQAVGKNALAGAAGESSLYDPGATSLLDKAPEAAFAGGVSAAVSSLLAIPQSGRNAIAKLVDDADKINPRPRRLAAQAESASPRGFSLGQLTGIPYLKTLEAKTYNSEAVAFYADQLDNIVGKYVSDLSSGLAGRTAAGEGVKTVKAITEDVLDQLETTGKKAWKTGIAEASGFAQQARLSGGGVIAIPQFEEALQRNLRLANSPLTELLGKNVPEINNAIMRVGSMTRKGGININEADTLLQDIEDLKNWAERNPDQISPKQLEIMVGSLTDGIHKDLRAVRAYDPLMQKAADRLEEARGAYKLAKDMARGLEGSAAYQMFGPGGPQSVEALFDVFKDYTPSAQRDVVTYLEQHAPVVLDGLKRNAINRAAKAARHSTPAADTPLVLGKFAEALEGTNKAPNTLWTAKELDHIQKVKDALRVLENQRPGFSYAGTAIRPEDVAPNLASQSIIFISRQLARYLEGNKASKIFFDPNVYRGLLRINNTSGANQFMSRAGLATYLNATYGEPQPTDENNPN